MIASPNIEERAKHVNTALRVLSLFVRNATSAADPGLGIQGSSRAMLPYSRASLFDNGFKIKV